ncbi:monocarboxylate transporter 12-like [Lingula anatina]|uniref:Monocarboxylate transporter 12-like n=1 Tax=Lingula anatina TaxID=7574 RepID=A0A1S3I7L3_LINAN|nr:monocarboxylate transporter 12-like [Lingula anatina]|eukprot:XP_013393841.1 monocarboxylate transporter 12-like [Lingula anatina]
MGLLLLGTTISTVGSPPFLGWVADTTGSYSWLFRICGISMVTASTILCLEPVARKYEVKKEQLAAGTSDLVQTDQTCTQKLNGNLVET